MNKNYYGSLASLIYNFTKPPGTSIDGDIEFYTKMLMPRDGLVLEAGVGNGRMLIPLARKGINIIGIDNSQEMIDICKENISHYNLDSYLEHAELRDFKYHTAFDSIIMPNGSFCLIQDKTEAIDILKNFRSLLTDDGQVMLDLIYPISFKPGDIHKKDYQVNDQTITLENRSLSMDWEHQKTKSLFTYTQDDVYEEQNFELNWYGIDEFKMILKSVGFSKIEVIKNYGDKRMLNLKTVTFIAKK
ncbi:class I SAM-dependent methyltransferase [Mesoplasma photuris]|uniref:class I SAM-dependent methyltransferase n=1 Tax=Mesoplasma photuris TaxID=217731 RepID=UPI0004E184BD|nr:class I SAM-dependent methyltransferase [Mesoplasma photuris]